MVGCSNYDFEENIFFFNECEYILLFFVNSWFVLLFDKVSKKGQGVVSALLSFWVSDIDYILLGQRNLENMFVGSDLVVG